MALRLYLWLWPFNQTNLRHGEVCDFGQDTSLAEIFYIRPSVARRLVLKYKLKVNLLDAARNLTKRQS